MTPKPEIRLACIVTLASPALVGDLERSEHLVDESGRRPLRTVRHPCGDIALALGLCDPFDESLGDGKLVLQ